MDTYNYIIYHKNCFDGFTGFYIFMKTKNWTKNPIVYPDYPSASKIPPNIKNKNVIIIDVAYSAKIIDKIAEQCNKLLFIDHHVSIAKDVKNLNLDPKHKIIYDVNECGATLTWKHFFKNKKQPKFLTYIRDNDIGLWKSKETLPFIAGLEVNFITVPDIKNLKKWDALLDDKYLVSMIKKGKSYNEYKNHLIKRHSKKHVIKKFNKYNVAVINGGCPSVSLLGKYIVNNIECDFCMIWNYNMKQKKYIISMRSKKTDVGKIAKNLGGGGHKYAAAFSISYPIDKLFLS